ncbi:hypothetical protein MSLAZ_3082 [Methanosarcina lacustris Z-7289]|uniref:Uncharacterized protein n=1 Tax=Methanosarcina lacustris Z-7289 TaxID=1434111 RepID=A0A0E3SAS4_9EURY|nr:hypothetical protein MSLAZ_3082 [Methanosarcina lacustris Z-7289]
MTVEAAPGTRKPAHAPKHKNKGSYSCNNQNQQENQECIAFALPVCDTLTPIKSDLILSVKIISQNYQASCPLRIIFYFFPVHALKRI